MKNNIIQSSILIFFKNRFPLVIAYSILLVITGSPSIREIIYVMLILITILFLHDLLHEAGHAIMATLLGFKVTRFTTNRVYIENEPSSFEEIRLSKDRVKYAIVGIFGFITTTSTGYILLATGHNARPGMNPMEFYCWYFILLVYLLGDPWYLAQGSISMKGDSVGISAGFNISK